MIGDVLIVLGIAILVIVLVFAGAVQLSAMSCESFAAINPTVNVQFDQLLGCMIQLDNGVWVSTSRYLSTLEQAK